MKITFCGHSQYSYTLEDEKQLLLLLEIITKNENVEFYLGGYGNFDAFALACAKKFKQRHPQTKLILVTPYLNKRINDTDAYNEVVYPALENVPPKYAILKRNEWMIENADYLFAYVKTHFGGAYKCLLYAHKHGKAYTNLYQGKYELF